MALYRERAEEFCAELEREEEGCPAWVVGTAVVLLVPVGSGPPSRTGTLPAPTLPCRGGARFWMPCAGTAGRALWCELGWRCCRV